MISNTSKINKSKGNIINFFLKILIRWENRSAIGISQNIELAQFKLIDHKLVEKEFKLSTGF